MKNRSSKDQVASLMTALRELNATYSDPVNAGELSRWLDLKEKGSTYPAARRVVSAAIGAGHAILSNRHGYFVARSEKQLQVYLNDLMQRQIKLSGRILGVYKAFHGYGPKNVR